MSDDRPGEPADEGAGTTDEPADAPKPPLPRATVGPSPVAQVATAAVVVVVLVVLGVVFLVQGGGKESTLPEQDTGTVPTVPTVPSSGFQPSRADPLPPLPSIPASLCPKAPLKKPLTVLTFNIHHGATKDEHLQLGRIGTEIKTWDPDIVLLQEVDQGRSRTGGIQQAEALARATDLTWVYGGNQRSRGSGPIGNAILSRFPVVEWHNTLLPIASGREQRGLLHAVINVDGTEISAYATHFDHASGVARLAQARTTIKVLAADPRPKILAGDLNTGPGGAPIRALRAAGLGDAWAVGSGAGNTVPARNPRNRIDYVLHDGWFTPLQAVVLASGVSDHRAVWTRLEFRQELGCFKVGG